MIEFMKNRYILLTLSALLATSCQHPQAPASRLDLPLYMADSGRAFQVSSHDPTEGDAWSVKPGETKVLANIAGPAILRNLWFTLAGAAGNQHGTNELRNLTLRIFWDDETTPSVETPFGDFFGCGFGQYKHNLINPYVMVTSRGYNCYFPMPFRKSARIELTNGGGHQVMVFFHFLGAHYDRLPEDMLYFHAQWRRENPTETGRNYTVLHTQGRGYFAGVQLFMQGYTKGDKNNFLEGDEWISIDGETDASIKGTGTEDYFQGAWYFMDGPFLAPYHGLTYQDPENIRYGCYRFHTQDRINFQKEIRVEIEHGQRTCNEAKADYSSVAYYYQTEPHTPFAPISEDRAPTAIRPAFLIPGAVEFEGTPGSSPYYGSTYFGDWSNDMAGLLPWKAAGKSVDRTFNVSKAGFYRITAHYIGQDHGAILQAAVDGGNVGDPVDTWTEAPLDAYLLCRNRPLGARQLGVVSLTPGEHTLTLHAIGKNEKSKGFQALIDCVAVEPQDAPAK
jgi:hypothetical protein